MPRLSLSLLFALLPVAVAFAQPAKDAKEDAAVLEKTIFDAPGSTNCWQNNSGDRLLDCEKRDEGLKAFQRLYELDKKRATAILQKRFDEIPSPKGGYFPILAAAQVKDKAFVPMLKKVVASNKETRLGEWSTQAISVIETGKCTKVAPYPQHLREICR